MLTFRCCLHFSDGEELVAQLSADSPLKDAPIIYDGPTGRLPVVPPIASAVELKAYFQSFARELQARYSEHFDLPPVVLSDEPPIGEDSSAGSDTGARSFERGRE